MRPTPADRDDPRAQRRAMWVRFFQGAMARQMHRSFHAVRVANLPEPHAIPAGVPLVVYCNHPSWWDGAFLPVLAARLFPQRRAYGPIDADAMKRYPFMRRIGFFPVDQADAHAGASAWLHIGSALLAEPDTLLFVTPQGRFSDPRERPIALRAGLAALLTRAAGATVLPLALEYPFWIERTPEALARFGSPVELPSGGSRVEVQAALEVALQDSMQALSRDAIARSAARFETLIEGSAGVGGIYDAVRRGRSWLKGERFDASHGGAAARARRGGP